MFTSTGFNFKISPWRKNDNIETQNLDNIDFV